MRSFFYLFCFVGVVLCSEYWISPFGSNSNSGTSSSDPWQTLSFGITSASVNDTIYCLPGLFSTNQDVGITIDKSIIISIDGDPNSVTFACNYSCEMFSFSDSIEVSFNGLSFSKGANIIMVPTNSILRFESCSFYESSADAVTYSPGNSNLFFNNCIFAKGNIAINSKSNITISNSVFKFNHADYPIIHFSGATLSISNSIFIGNVNSYVSYGGTIYLTDVPYVQIISCSFDFNSVTRTSAGAIFSANSNTYIQDCTFNNNTSGNSGGAIATDQSTINIISSDFNFNSGPNDGGALYFSDSTAYISNVTFNTNTASKGGACYEEGSVINYSTINASGNNGSPGNCFPY